MFSGFESSRMMQNDPHAAITRDSELLTDGVKKSPSSTIFAGSTFGKARVSNPPIVMSQRAKVSRTTHHWVWLCGSHAILYTKIVHNLVDFHALCGGRSCLARCLWCHKGLVPALREHPLSPVLTPITQTTFSPLPSEYNPAFQQDAVNTGLKGWKLWKWV